MLATLRKSLSGLEGIYFVALSWVIEGKMQQSHHCLTEISCLALSIFGAFGLFLYTLFVRF